MSTLLRRSSTAMTPERELVLALCRTPLAQSQRERAENLLRGGIDWDVVFQTAAMWEVEPVAMSNLRLHLESLIPPEIIERSSLRERDSRAGSLARTLILLDLVERLSAESIHTIVLKGPAIGVMAYGGESFRTFADIDLLVSRDDLIRARDFLISLGYTCDYSPQIEERLISDQHALELSRPGVKVELHWSLISRHLRLDIDPSEIQAESISIECAAKRIRVLAPHHLLVFLCAHGAKHEWDRLRWICDVAQLTQRLTPSQATAAVELASRVHAKRILAVGIQLSISVFGSLELGIPFRRLLDEQRIDTVVNSVTRSLLQTAREADRVTTFSARVDPRLRPLVFWARVRERRLDRIACLARVFFVPTENDSGMRPLRWITRPVRLARRAARNILRVRATTQ